MWYNGEAKGRSWIGLATSADGKTWTRAAVHRTSRYGQTRPLRYRGLGKAPDIVPPRRGGMKDRIVELVQVRD